MTLTKKQTREKSLKDWPCQKGMNAEMVQIKGFFQLSDAG